MCVSICVLRTLRTVQYIHTYDAPVRWGVSVGVGVGAWGRGDKIGARVRGVP